MIHRSSFLRRAFPLLGVLILGLVLPATAAAQDNGLIRGTVTDDTGAVVPGATATLLSEAVIGGSRSSVTNDSGVFRFPALPPGEYAVEVSLAGFDTVRFEGVRVGLNTTATLNAALRLSTVTEIVQVVAEAPAPRCELERLDHHLQLRAGRGAPHRAQLLRLHPTSLRG